MIILHDSHFVDPKVGLFLYETPRSPLLISLPLCFPLSSSSLPSLLVAL